MCYSHARLDCIMLLSDNIVWLFSFSACRSPDWMIWLWTLTFYEIQLPVWWATRVMVKPVSNQAYLRKCQGNMWDLIKWAIIHRMNTGYIHIWSKWDPCGVIMYKGANTKDICRIAGPNKSNGLWALAKAVTQLWEHIHEDPWPFQSKCQKASVGPNEY